MNIKYRAVRNQHVLPKASIRRFYSENNCVQLMLNNSEKKIFPANADNSLFVADRKWDEKVEKGVKDIETRFQCLSDKLIANGNGKLESSDHETANIFYAILSERSKARYHNFDDSTLFDKSTINHFEMSESEREYHESQGLIFIGSENDRVIERAARGMAQSQAITHALNSNAKWGAFTTSCDFVVSDIYHYHAVIPVSPAIYLVKNKESRYMSSGDTTLFNKEIIKASQRFIFSRSLDALNN